MSPGQGSRRAKAMRVSEQVSVLGGRLILSSSPANKAGPCLSNGRESGRGLSKQKVIPKPFLSGITGLRVAHFSQQQTSPNCLCSD